MKKFKLGPLYTPPSMQGTLQRPGVIGGANWGGAAFDPETQTAVRENDRMLPRSCAFTRSTGHRKILALPKWMPTSSVT